MPSVAIDALDDCRTQGDGNHETCYPKGQCVYNVLIASVVIEVFCALVLTTIGLAGMPANVDIAIKILSTGLVQLFIGTPGIIAWKMRSNQMWLLYAVVQLLIGVAELCWFAEAVYLKQVYPACVLIFFTLVQLWCFVFTVLRLRISNCTQLSDIACGSSTSHHHESFSRSTKKVSSASARGLKSPTKRTCSHKTVSKSLTMKTIDESKPSTCSTSQCPIQNKRNRRDKRIKKVDQSHLTSVRDSEISVADRMKAIPEAKTPPLSSDMGSSIKNSKFKKPRRFYFSEYDDVNSLSESDPDQKSAKLASPQSRRRVFMPRGVIAMEVHTPPSSESIASPATPLHQTPIATPPLAVQVQPAAVVSAIQSVPPSTVAPIASTVATTVSNTAKQTSLNSLSQIVSTPPNA